MNIIFLDCDGVLSLMNQWNQDLLQDKESDFDKNCVERLNKLMEYFINLDFPFPNHFIVISSSWRYCKSTKDLQDIFKLRGFKYYNLIIGKTIGIDTLGFSLETRTEEILEWVNKNKVNKFIAIDDEEVLIQDLPKQNKIIVNEKFGLQDEHCEKTKEYFKN
jgi:hypothetical protein